jgi:hypothetical protein
MRSDRDWKLWHAVRFSKKTQKLTGTNSFLSGCIEATDEGLQRYVCFMRIPEKRVLLPWGPGVYGKGTV